MKKVLLAALASVSLFAADNNLYNHAIGVVGGYAINSEETGLSNDLYWGLRYYHNRTTEEGSIDIDAIQFAFDYDGDNLYNGKETSIYRLGTNALWYLENDSDYTPYALLGVGLQFFGENEAEDSNSMLFAAIGAGVEYQLRGDFSVSAEAKSLFAGDGSMYLLGNVGIKYSFGQNY